MDVLLCAVRQTIDYPETGTGNAIVFEGTAISSIHIVMALRCWFRGSTSKVQLRNSDTHSEFVGKCRLHRGGHNIDCRSIPQFPRRVLCVQTRKCRKTLSFEKLSVVYLQGKQFLSNVYEAVYRRQ